MSLESNHSLLSALLAVVAIFLSSARSLGAEPANVLVFADFACTENAVGDPDDCLAVEALRRSKHVKILAVVAAGGNSSSRRSFKLGKYNFPNLLILQGSSPRARRNNQTHRTLAKLIDNHEGSLKFPVLCPATDLAILLRFYPKAANAVEEVIFVAGRTKGDIFKTHSTGRVVRDMNFEKDRKAHQYLLPKLHTLGISTRFVGFRAAMNTPIPAGFIPEDFVRSAQRAWARKTKFWFGKSLPPFDVFAAMAVTPFYSKLRCRYVDVKVGYHLELSAAKHSHFTFCD